MSITTNYNSCFGFLGLQKEFESWLMGTQEKSKEIKCEINETDVEVVFDRGWVVYLGESNLHQVKPSINVVTTDAKIVSLFQNFFKRSDEFTDEYINHGIRNRRYYHLHQLSYESIRKFDLRFYPSRQELDYDLKERESNEDLYSIKTCSFCICNIL